MHLITNDDIVRIEKVLEKYKNPAMLISWGKDSTVLAFLLRHLRLPIICHQNPWQKQRWLHANNMNAASGSMIYDWPPEWTALQESEGRLELVSGYAIGGGQVLGIRQEIERSNEVNQHSACGLYDCLRQPAGTITPPWDLLITAQKNGDTDHFGGKHEVNEDIKQTGLTDVYFPLRNWTDADILHYISKHRLPIDSSRYDSEDLFPQTSPDIVRGCFKCVDRTGSPTTQCPRLNGLVVSNISSQVPYISHSTSI